MMMIPSGNKATWHFFKCIIHGWCSIEASIYNVLFPLPRSSTRGQAWQLKIGRPISWMILDILPWENRHRVGHLHIETKLTHEFPILLAFASHDIPHDIPVISFVSRLDLLNFHQKETMRTDCSWSHKGHKIGSYMVVCQNRATQNHPLKCWIFHPDGSMPTEAEKVLLLTPSHQSKS